MKIKTKIRIVIVSAVVSALLLAGCSLPGHPTGRGDVSGSTNDPYNAAFVVAITNNNPIVDVNRIEEFTNLTSSPGSTYTFVEADSTPDVIVDGVILDYTAKGYTDSMIERISTSVRLDLEQQVADTRPDSPGVDIVKSIELAVRTIHSNKVEGRRDVLVIYASGICDTGVLNMIDCPLCEVDVQQTVSNLSGSLNLNMEGIDIVWYCAGDVTGDQGALSDRERETLAALYEGLFEAAHARNVDFRQDLPPAGNYTFSQQVAVMKTEGETSLLHAKIHDSSELTSKGETSNTFVEGGMISFDEKQMAFQPDSVELKDEKAALKALDYVLDYMKDQEDFDLLIVGTTSSYGDNEEESRRFSEKRASSVMKLLASNGVDQDHLYCVGCGYSVPGLYTQDKNVDGSLNEALASQNRRVYLLDRDSDTAREILKQMGE